jgi:hypothetical protein
VRAKGGRDVEKAWPGLELESDLVGGGGGDRAPPGGDCGRGRLARLLLGCLLGRPLSLALQEEGEFFGTIYLHNVSC